jgi:hypothetical protein
VIKPLVRDSRFMLTIREALGFAPVERDAGNPALRQQPGCADNRSPDAVFSRREL